MSRVSVAGVLSHEIAVVDDIIDDLVLLVEPTLAGGEMVRPIAIVGDFLERIVQF